MTYLSLKDVSFTYPNGFEAVQQVNIDFELGESVAIIGQNGAGKTTTVKLMNGLLRPTKGDVLLAGKKTEKLTTAQMSHFVGYVFQNPDDQIFQDTIYNEISFGPKNQKLSKNEVLQKVQAAAELCGLEGVLQEHPYNLPYSKRKFITIAAVIATDPKVIILDEPTAGQDRQSTELLGRIINQLTKEGKTVITITHDMEFVVSEFSRVIVFAEKQKRREGTPAEIFWDETLLTISHLKQPYICQLAKLLGCDGVMTIQELLEVKEYEASMD
ncbi:energy-coupling factor ABC transporter ATP-binding protein [Candidatus Enterococcus ferrettii]|uniref:Energy-coupling factor transport system ATP-binding protein n=1 Tax=Candidatus Enterococcus ferrettii TaxID=2815324 RepID=A0ABV0EML5_9ENTE|nr:ABC transporter ATP-binding protein [Enterococcus sp. 665A]MBO1339749.1 ABC transporter ATP-binding protein [Enterococcus sp. 665A]